MYVRACVCVCVHVRMHMCVGLVVSDSVPRQSDTCLFIIPTQYCQSKDMVLVQPSDVHKPETARKLVLSTSSEGSITQLAMVHQV